MAVAIVLAPDSFKGTLSQAEAVDAMARGLARFLPGAGAAIVRCPMADGGEGTADVVASARGGTFYTCSVQDAYGRPWEGRWLLLDDGTALIEAASGPGFVTPEDRPRPGRLAHSRGLGLLMRDAMARGARRLVVALGGTGSTDGGLGALMELGARIDGVAEPGASALAHVAGLHLPTLAVPVDVWTDVLPPLTGPRGAVRRYGPQKGLQTDELDDLDAAMSRYGSMLDAAAGLAVSGRAGAGAAGGLGAALAAIGGRLIPGGVAVARAVGLPQSLSGADAVITGEGAVDVQSADGKVVGVVAHLARQASVPALVVAGRVDASADVLYGRGVTALFALSSPRLHGGAAKPAASALEDAMSHVTRWLDPAILQRYRIPGR
ncbi:MAG: glycerate kinase [Clostridia bacterium]